MAIPNCFKNIIDVFVDSCDNSSDTKILTIFRQVDIASNGISGLGDSVNGLKERRDILNNGS